MGGRTNDRPSFVRAPVAILSHRGMGERPVGARRNPGTSSLGAADAADQPPAVRRSVSLDAAVLSLTSAEENFTACAKPEWLEPRCHFETAVPPGEAIRHAITAVQKVGATVTDIKPKKSKIKCSLLHNFSSVIFHITIFQASKGSGMYIMEFQKRRGDSFIWNQVFSHLYTFLSPDLFPRVQIPLAKSEMVGSHVNEADAASERKNRIPKFMLPDKVDNSIDRTSELATLAVGMLEMQHLEAQGVAARAFAHVAASLKLPRKEDEMEALPESLTKLRIEDSLSVLKGVNDAETQQCVASTLGDLDGTPTAIVSPQRACLGDLWENSMRTCGFGMTPMLSS